MNSNLKLFRPLFSYLFWNTNFCAMFPFCLVPLMWNVILYPTSTRMFYYHFNKIHIIIDNFHLKIEKKTKQKTKGSFILTPFCQHVHVLPMKPHHKINFFFIRMSLPGTTAIHILQQNHTILVVKVRVFKLLRIKTV